MAGAQETISIAGVKEVSDLLKKFSGPETFRTLHERWSIQGLKWVDENFRQQGALTGTKWTPLAKSTLARRRKGGGEGKAQILIDSGDLRKSFVRKFDEHEATIGSPLFYAEYHEEGRGPWAIRRKRTTKTGRNILSRVGRHPGLPQRRMLPRSTDTSWMDKMKLVANNLFKQLVK